MDVQVDAPNMPNPLLTELDPSLLRGVKLSAALSAWGRPFSMSSRYEIDQDFHGSFMVQIFHHFISHDWQTSRHAKTLSLMLIFNTRGAFLATLPWCVIVGLLKEPMPPVASIADWTVDLRDFVVYLIFLFFFCFWQRIRTFLKKPVVVFLDKLCIAQQNSDQKAQGILGLASFLDRSTNLTILCLDNFRDTNPMKLLDNLKIPF